MTYVLLGVIVLLCIAILHAHKKHADALTEMKNAFASMRRDFNTWRDRNGAPK